MKVFAQWVLGRRYRLILVAIAAAPILPIVTMALMTMETMRRGGLQGVYSAAAGIGGVLLLSMTASTDINSMVVLATATFGAGVALGMMVRWANSLVLAFQGSLLLCVVAVAVALALWPDPGSLMGAAIDEFVEMLRGNSATEEQIAVIRGWTGLLFGLFGAFAFVQLTAALLLGYWLNSLDGAEGSFGREFRALKLGRVLGIPATLLMASYLVLDVALVQNLFLLVLLGFWFQGLAVTHAWAKVKRWHPAVLGGAYLLLVTPLTGLVILAMGSVGLVDNWFDLRAPLRAVA